MPLCGAASATEAVVATAAPTLFHAFGERALLVGFRATPPLGCILTDSGDVTAIRNGLPRCGRTSPHRGTVEGGSQHDHKAHDAQRDDLGHRASHQQHDAEDEHGASQGDTSVRTSTEIRATHGRSKLRVLSGERLLHLFEQSLFVIGERHVSHLYRAPGQVTIETFGGVPPVPILGAAPARANRAPTRGPVCTVGSQVTWAGR